MSDLKNEILEILKLEFDEKLATSSLNLACNKIGKTADIISKEDIKSLIPLLGEAILLYGTSNNLSTIFEKFSALAKK